MLNCLMSLTKTNLKSEEIQPKKPQHAREFILDTLDIYQYSFHREFVNITWIGRNILSTVVIVSPNKCYLLFLSHSTFLHHFLGP
jgi:hypothetical protein